MAKQKTAQETCEEMRGDIASLTDHLQGLLQTSAGCNGWDEAGSLEHVRHLLKHVVAFYGGLCDGEIEETLAEIRESGKGGK